MTKTESSNREQAFIDFFTHLTVDNLSKIDEVFAVDARFKDPFNDVIGIDAIKTVFRHMFETTEKPVFIVNHHANNQEKLFIQWRFNFIKNNRQWHIDGTSMVTFNENNQVQEHLDYWDPAEQIYSKVGLLKPMMNFLKSRLTANNSAG